MLTLFFFLLAVTLLVAVHEYGHYRVAVACGVRVERFSIGFGPVIYRWRPRRPRPGQDTEFVISALPLGGYVRMLDESMEPVPESLQAQAFHRQPLGRRALIVVAGPVANLLLAWLLLAGLLWIGQNQWRAQLASPVPGSLMAQAGLNSGDEVTAVVADGHEWDVVSYEDLRWYLARSAAQKQQIEMWVKTPGGGQVRRLDLDLSGLKNDLNQAEGWQELGLQGPWSAPVLNRILPNGQAEAMGLRAGDRVLQMDAWMVRDAAHLRQLIRDSVDASGHPQSRRWRLERDGQIEELEVQVRVLDQGERRIGRIDAMVGLEPDTVLVRRQGLDALGHAGTRLLEMSETTGVLMWRMLTGDAPLSHLGGPLTMAEQAGKTAEKGWQAYVMYLVWVSLSLGLLNLLPIPVLDGGHLMCYLYEWIVRRPMSPQWWGFWQRVGIFMVLLLMAIAIGNDLARWWSTS